jgi:hypothetical protein
MTQEGLGLDLTLDWETADRITVATLKNYLETLEHQLENYHNGSWLHADDVVHSHEMIKAVKFVLRDFGVYDE